MPNAERRTEVLSDKKLEEGQTSSSGPSSPRINDSSSYESSLKEWSDVEWAKDPANAYNWSAWKKAQLVAQISTGAFVASTATSIVSPAQKAFMEEFGVSETVALLPLSLYVFALGFGPVIGGPLSETIGRQRVYQSTTILGSLFTLGVGWTHNFGALCFLRFAAGFCWAPALAIGTGSLAETFKPKSRGPMVAIYILMPFLGPGFGPILGSFAVSRQNWRWTQWILLMFAALAALLVLVARETFPPALKRRLAKDRGYAEPPRPPFWSRTREFLTLGLVRPLHMLCTEPIITFVCLYVAVNFGILFSMFAAVPYTFVLVYQFNTEESGLVFSAVVAGCLLGFMTLLTFDAVLYRPQTARYKPNQIPPEQRLYAAMIGSIGLPTSLFWFAWAARSDVSWVSPAVAIVPFSWGNLCVFVSFSQYMSDTYKPKVMASYASANSLARYAFAGSFPLFIVQMFKRLHISWALSIFGFVSIALLPIPWIFFKFGPRIRARSRYDTHKYEERQ